MFIQKQKPGMSQARSYAGHNQIAARACALYKRYLIRVIIILTTLLFNFQSHPQPTLFTQASGVDCASSWLLCVGASSRLHRNNIYI